MPRFNLWYLSLLLFLGSQVSGYELLEPGSKANSLAGSFIGISDDWTAIYWNPAGLFQLEDKELAIEEELILIKIHDGDSIANDETVFGYRDPSEIARFSKGDVFKSHYLPSIGYVLPMKGLTFGLGLYPRLYDYLYWEDEVSDLEALIKREFMIYNGGIAFSAHIAPLIYGGISLNLLCSEYQLLKEKEYRKNSSYTYRYHLGKASGTGLEVVLGTLYEPGGLFSVGLVYRSGGIIRLRGDAEASCSKQGVTQASGYTRSIQLPPSYGIGLGIRIPKTTIEIDWSRVGWESWKEYYEFTDEGSLLVNSDNEKSPRLSGADRWHLGLKIDPYRALRIMLGCFYSQSPLKSSGIDIYNGMIEMERTGLSFGLLYKVGNLEFDLGYLLSNGQDEIEGVGYRRDLNKVQFSIKADFL